MAVVAGVFSMRRIGCGALKLSVAGGLMRRSGTNWIRIRRRRVQPAMDLNEVFMTEV